MPKSKRRREDYGTATKRKGMEHKERLVTRVREALDSFSRVFVVRHRNMRNRNLDRVRSELGSHGRIFMGSTKVLAVALGRDEASEYKEGLHKLSARLKGYAGVITTDLTKVELSDLLTRCSEPQFAKAGNEAPETVTLGEGKLTWDEEEPTPGSLEPRLRKLGMPVRLNKGDVELTADFTVCTAGQRLTREQAAILRQFGYTFGQFEMVLDSLWDESGDDKEPSFCVLSEPDERDAIVQARQHMGFAHPLVTA